MLFKFLFSRMFLFEGDGGSGDGSADEKAKAEAEAKAKTEQEALNKQFAERAAQAASAERKKILESLGVTDLDQALALTKAAKEADEKNKSEAEKLAARATAAEEAQKKAEAEASAKLEAATKKLLDSEIRINASAPVMEKEKVVRPAFKKEALDDVLLLIDRSKIEEADGTFKNVDKALNDLAKAKPWLLAEPATNQRRGTPPEGSGRRTQGGDGEPRTPIISSL